MEDGQEIVQQEWEQVAKDLKVKKEYGINNS